MFKQARWMLLAAMVLAGGLIGARPAAADHAHGLPHKSLPQRHFGTVLGDHMDHRCCARAQRCDYTEENKIRKNDRTAANGKITCCAYVACCEVGNRGFFSKTTCQTCTERSGAPVHTGQGSCCCNSPKGETHRYH